MNMEILQVLKDSTMQRLTGRAADWIISFGPRIILAIALFFAGQWMIRMINTGFKKVLAARRFDATLRPFIQNLLQIVLQVLLALAIMQVLGIHMTLFAAVVGALGVAVGLALSGTLQNFASGVLIILLKPFVVGDNIKTQGEEGSVVYIRLFYTVIRTFNNTTLIVPNSKLSNEVIFNLTREQTRRLDINIKFNYTVDFAQVKDIISKTIDSFDQCLKDPPPRVGIEKIEADGFTIVLNAWLNSHGYQDSRLELNERLMNELKPVMHKP